MRLIGKIATISIMIGLGVMPVFAKLDGSISKNNVYDTEKTIMTEIPPTQNIKTGKYWEKNLFYFSKYHPLFMLSNKEIYNLMQREKVNAVPKTSIMPSVYNISLKTMSIRNISLAQEPSVKPLTTLNSSVSKPLIITPKMDDKSIYEEAKNPNVDSDRKIEAALSLSKSKDAKNYSLALDLLEDVTRKEPYNAYAFYLKGELYSKKKDLNNAMQNYVEALKINPTSKQSCLGIAKMLEGTNKNLSRKYYDRAMLLSEI